MKILTETNYRKFRFIVGNRDILPKKIENLIKSYNNGINLFPFCPILVNKDMYVIDGQHRLEACKKLKIDVHYTIIPDFTIQQIAEINSTMTKWSMKDYMQAYAKTGRKDYEILELFRSKYELGYAMAIALLMNGTSSVYGTNFLDEFRAGRFCIKYRDKAEKIMKHVVDYVQFLDHKINRDFIRCIELLIISDLYKHTEVIEKFKRTKAKIEPRKTYKLYISQLEDLYNKGNQMRYFLYQKAGSTQTDTSVKNN